MGDFVSRKSFSTIEPHLVEFMTPEEIESLKNTVCLPMKYIELFYYYDCYSKDHEQFSGIIHKSLYAPFKEKFIDINTTLKHYDKNGVCHDINTKLFTISEDVDKIESYLLNDDYGCTVESTIRNNVIYQFCPINHNLYIEEK